MASWILTRAPYAEAPEFRQYKIGGSCYYLFINNSGLVQYWNSLGIPMSDWKEEVEEIELI